MKTGIYKILNKINGKCYIGSSHRIQKRWKYHLNQLSKNIHHSVVLQRAWNKYGENSFSFEIIEECKQNQLIQREQYYLDLLQPEYNCSPTAGSTLGMKCNLSNKERRRRAKQITKIAKSNSKLGEDMVIRLLDDIYLNRLTILEVATKYNISRSSVGDIIHGRIWADINRTKYHGMTIRRALLSNKTKKKMSLAKRGEGTHLSKLTEVDVYKIKLLIRDGLSNREIATKFQVDHSTIWHIKTGKTWKHINV